MTQAPRRFTACLSVLALSVLTSLAACDKPPGEPKVAPSGTTTAPTPMPSASAASQ
ncbi:MAG TPA: hypothetical protein VHQ87_18890 [Rhizobacter sp.]|nr:hypothetical protein [Rhizobacter sp.]